MSSTLRPPLPYGPTTPIPFRPLPKPSYVGFRPHGHPRKHKHSHKKHKGEIRVQI